MIIHAWVDITCPWSWIGVRRLQEGIAKSGKSALVEYHSYQLQVDAPGVTSLSLIDYLADIWEKSPAEVKKQLADISDIGAECGINFNWESVQPVNSFLAHQLLRAAQNSAPNLEVAAAQGQEMLNRLWKAYFQDGDNISDTYTLLNIAEAAGLDREQAEIDFESGEYADEVRADLHAAETLGISGVPFFLLADKYAIEGAQSAQVFAEAIAALSS